MVRTIFVGLITTLTVTGLVLLGNWQLDRRAWKLDLIARVDSRVHASASAAPGPADWARVTAASDEYRHVQVTGTFMVGRTILTKAVTDLGAGFWVITPLRADRGFVVLINRGFIPANRRRDLTDLTGSITVTGLLRLTEPKGGFLRSNDPVAGRWYSRDVAAMATAEGLTSVAPYFIDADATPGPIAFPVGGLTVIDFPNNHLIYAITWYSLALMLAVTTTYLGTERWRGDRISGLRHTVRKTD